MALGASMLAFAGLAQPISFSAVGGMADYARVVELNCNFEYRSGLEFQFPSADPVLRPYGFVLWKSKPSIVSRPLDYSLYQGHRGKLSGETVLRDGIRWYTGVLDDCSRIYAEDASAHAQRPGLEHLMFHGKVFFAETYAAAKKLIGHDVIVRGPGLEPRQRLYTRERDTHYSLSDKQVLRVVGIDTHRYAHAKGVGPFFLQLENADGKQGLIKYNPDYLEVPHGILPVSVPLPGRGFAQTHLPARKDAVQAAVQGNQPMPRQRAYLLSVQQFRNENQAAQAMAELQQAGFDAVVMPQPKSQGGPAFELRIEGFSSAALARSMARILANRFGWIKTDTTHAVVASRSGNN